MRTLPINMAYTLHGDQKNIKGTSSESKNKKSVQVSADNISLFIVPTVLE